MSTSPSSTQSILLVTLSVAATAGILYFLYSRRQLAASSDFAADHDGNGHPASSRRSVGGETPSPHPPQTRDGSTTTNTSIDTPEVVVPTNNAKSAEKDLHLRIEGFDKRGKVLFKEKQVRCVCVCVCVCKRGRKSASTNSLGVPFPVVQSASLWVVPLFRRRRRRRRHHSPCCDRQFLEAAQAFTEAIDLIESQGEDVTNALVRQWLTLMNNRSAMYEKANLPELALEDCTLILDKDVEHSKARARRLRLLEEMKRWNDALVEVCAVQLLFMKANRTNMRMGLPLPPPPIPPTRLEELLAQVLPDEVENYTQRMKEETNRALPCAHTILQLLRSYVGYNQWMGQAARDGSVDRISSSLLPADQAIDSDTKAKRASGLLKRGRRRVYDRDYDLASHDFEEAMALVESDEAAQHAMEDDSYARLLEWTGMVRHWHYNLNSALGCYQKCADLEPTNANVLVKQAGVQMDAGKHDEAMKLFDTALGIDPAAVDALLHRSNLKMLLGKAEEAKVDLEACLALRPNHVMARLRLASILAAQNDPTGAKRELDLAEQEEPNSSEVQSYRGELFFTQGQMDEALEQFEKAIQLEPSNPTPYLNAALALLNTPTAPGQPPDANAMVTYLEKAIEVDPQFTAAYMQLGQLTLGMATDLNAAREVIKLYDQGLANCRTLQEIQELCSMRILTVAQVEAATMLKMEVFSLQ